MDTPHEEEFELVLGNKQILSLFFFAVVLFGVFFSLGYMVGFSRGQDDRAASIASTTPLEAPENEVRLPDTLLEEAPKSTEPAVTALPEAAAATPARASTKKPKPPRKAASAPTPKPRTPAPSRSAPAGAAVARAIHLQVSALRVRSDAQMLVEKLQAKGYPAVLYDQADDGWNRVLVGPFADAEAAKGTQERLQSDGLKTLLRRP